VIKSLQSIGDHETDGRETKTNNFMRPRPTTMRPRLRPKFGSGDHAGLKTSTYLRLGLDTSWYAWYRLTWYNGSLSLSDATNNSFSFSTI